MCGKRILYFRKKLYHLNVLFASALVVHTKRKGCPHVCVQPHCANPLLLQKGASSVSRDKVRTLLGFRGILVCPGIPLLRAEFHSGPLRLIATFAGSSHSRPLTEPLEVISRVETFLGGCLLVVSVTESRISCVVIPSIATCWCSAVWTRVTHGLLLLG